MEEVEATEQSVRDEQQYTFAERMTLRYCDWRQRRDPLYHSCCDDLRPVIYVLALALQYGLPIVIASAALAWGGPIFWTGVQVRYPAVAASIVAFFSAIDDAVYTPGTKCPRFALFACDPIKTQLMLLSILLVFICIACCMCCLPMLLVVMRYPRPAQPERIEATPDTPTATSSDV